jgi:DNA mismatch endonuclease, patch repair protein
MRTVPRFTNFKAASETASRIKKRNRSRDTKAEMTLRKELWRLGLRYRLHASDLPGKPDIVFRRARVAVFCDGDFWHGRDWPRRRRKLARGANALYWTTKIASNVARDRRNTRLLRAAGWTVLRLWETDVLREVAKIVARVASAVRASDGDTEISAVRGSSRR